MNRSVTFLQLGGGQLVELQQLLRSQSIPSAVRKRAALIWQLAAGVSLAKASERAGLSYPNAHHCMRRFLKLGMGGLHDRARAGRPRRYGSRETSRILKSAATPPRDLGLDFITWTLPRLEEYLRGQRGLGHLARSTIRRRLIEAGMHLQAGRFEAKARV
jgi:transposase